MKEFLKPPPIEAEDHLLKLSRMTDNAEVKGEGVNKNIIRVERGWGHIKNTL